MRKCAICGHDRTKVFDGLVEWCKHCGACREISSYMVGSDGEPTNVTSGPGGWRRPSGTMTLPLPTRGDAA